MPNCLLRHSLKIETINLFWIDASSAGTIIQGLKGICNLPEAQSCGLDGSFESALWWIGAQRNNYAMVFDNVDVLSPGQLEAYFPPGKGGNILITSCNSGMQRLTSPGNSLEVTEMAENDAIELLLAASFLDISRADFRVEASKIVKELFCIPLAVDQAGALIGSGAIDIGDYLEKFFEHRPTLLSHQYHIQNLQGHQNIIEQSMKPGNYHVEKSTTGLNVEIFIKLGELIMQYCFWHFSLSSIMRVSLRKFFLMLLFRKVDKFQHLAYHLHVPCWITNYSP